MIHTEDEVPIDSLFPNSERKEFISTTIMLSNLDACIREGWTEVERWSNDVGTFVSIRRRIDYNANANT